MRTGFGATGSDPSNRTDVLVGQRAVRDPDEATAVISELYLPHRLLLPPRVREVDLRLRGFQLGELTVGRLQYGVGVVHHSSVETGDFILAVPLSGRASATHGTGRAATSMVGQSLVFSPGAPAQMSWSPDCVQLCVVLPRRVVEHEVTRLLGAAPRTGLRFEFGTPATGGIARRWETLVRLLTDEVENPTGMMHGSVAGRHVESLLVDGLLLAQPHNHSAALLSPAPAGAARAVRRAVGLMEDRPGEPWTVVRLAAELNLSVRALQEGFRRHLDVPPMTYLRQVRLRQARSILRQASPDEVTVREVAAGLGMFHLSRFAAAYREEHGEDPSATLRDCG